MHYRRLGFLLLTVTAVLFALRPALSIVFDDGIINAIILVTIFPAGLALIIYLIFMRKAHLEYTPRGIAKTNFFTAFASIFMVPSIEIVVEIGIVIASLGIIFASNTFFEVLLGLSAASFYFPIAVATHQQIEFSFS